MFKGVAYKFARISYFNQIQKLSSPTWAWRWGGSDLVYFMDGFLKITWASLAWLGGESGSSNPLAQLRPVYCWGPTNNVYYSGHIKPLDYDDDDDDDTYSDGLEGQSDDERSNPVDNASDGHRLRSRSLTKQLRANHHWYRPCVTAHPGHTHTNELSLSLSLSLFIPFINLFIYPTWKSCKSTQVK